MRYARWDLSAVWAVDATTGAVLARLYPQDKAKNAEGLRRALSPADATALAEPTAPSGMAPLLRQLMARYAATGHPPAYLLPDREDDKSTPKPEIS